MKKQKYPQKKKKLKLDNGWGALDLLEPEDILDLHGLDTFNAENKIHSFLAQALKNNYQKIQIITGAGLHSPNNISILKPLAKKIIKEYDLDYKENYSGSALNIKLF